MKELCLYNLKQAGVIILDDTGPTYFNQVGGSSCLQPRVQGFFVPISNDPPLDQPELGLSGRLSRVTKNSVGLSLRDAEDINALLREVSSSDEYTVDTLKLADSCEAWVYIVITPEGEFSQFSGYPELKAILTWPNSD